MRIHAQIGWLLTYEMGVELNGKSRLQNLCLGVSHLSTCGVTCGLTSKIGLWGGPSQVLPIVLLWLTYSDCKTGFFHILAIHSDQISFVKHVLDPLYVLFIVFGCLDTGMVACRL